MCRKGSSSCSRVDLYDMTHANEVMRRVPAGRANTLQSRMGTGGNQVQLVHEYTIAGNIIDRKPENGGNGLGCQEGVSYTLNTNDRHGVEACGTVRRLTPLECERLQGLPAGWTAGGSDTARYKALGNGMALPCADFVLSQIVAYALQDENEQE